MPVTRTIALVAILSVPATFITPSALAQCCCGECTSSKPTLKPDPSSMGMAVTQQPSLGDPYPLATCPITGNKLGAMGEPVIKTYEGREVRFCCRTCLPKFEKDLAASLAALDEKLVKDQLAIYPLATSIVSGKKLPGKPFDLVFNNRLVRLADEGERLEFRKEPAKHLASLDKAVIERQLADYPLTKCPVSDERLGETGEPMNLVIAGRLIRLGCHLCVEAVNKDPAKYIGIIDEARKSAKKDNKPSKPVGSAATFTCPMHPEVTSDRADARCPKCGMGLVPKK